MTNEPRQTDERPETLTRSPWFWAVLACFSLAGTLALNDALIYTPDSARYVAWANSLAQGRGYIDGTVPEPLRYVVHAPLYPLLLVPAALVMPGSVVALKALTLLFGAALLWLFGLLLQRHASRAAAIGGMALLAINPLMLVYSTQVLSDVVFGISILAFLLLGMRLIEESPAHRTVFPLFVVSIAAGIFLREVGLTLLAAGAVMLAWKRQFRRMLILLAVVAGCYLIWMVRNEILVAGVENPPLRNTQLFFKNFFTVEQAGLGAEFAARIANNVRIYAVLIGRIVFFPEYTGYPLPVIARSSVILSGINTVLVVLYYPLVLLTLILAGFGIAADACSRKLWRFAGTFLLFYCIPVLCYPINDVRFLFPLLLIFTVYVVLGMRALHGWTAARFARVPKTAALFAGAICVLALPNFAWDASFVSHAFRFGRAPLEYYEQVKNDPGRPLLYSHPFRAAADWMAGRNTVPATVLSRWKEAVFGLPDGRIIVLDPFATVDELERMIRDYRVRYLVSVIDANGIPEFGPQMQISRRYAFIPAYRAGDVQVYAVAPKGAAGAAWTAGMESEPARNFREGIRMLECGDYAAADTLFRRAWLQTAGSASVVLYTALAREFAGNTADAAELMQVFRRLPQAGAFIEQAWYHQTIIARLDEAQRAAAPTLKAALLQQVSINYWELGFRRRSFEVLEQSIAADSTFIPTYVFKIYFSLLEGDTVGARAVVDNMQRRRILYGPAAGFARVMQLFEALKRSPGAQRMSIHLALAAEYQNLGLRELSIDELLPLAETSPEALEMLGDLYRKKHRYEPALRAYEALARLNGGNPKTMANIAELQSRW